MKCAAQQITAARGPQPPSKIHCTNKQNAFELIDFAPELGLDCWFCCSINSWLLQTTIKIYCFCCIQRDDDCDAGLVHITKQLSILSSLSMVKQILHCCCCFCWNVVQRRINSNSVGGLKSIWPIFVLRLRTEKNCAEIEAESGLGIDALLLIAASLNSSRFMIVGRSVCLLPRCSSASELLIPKCKNYENKEILLLSWSMLANTQYRQEWNSKLRMSWANWIMRWIRFQISS